MVGREEHERVLHRGIDAGLGDATALEPRLVEVVAQRDGAHLEVGTTEVGQ